MAYRRGKRGFSFKRPNMMAVWTEIILLALWLFFGDKIITVISNLVGVAQLMNVSDAKPLQSINCVNGSIFIDAYKILGIGHDCTKHVDGAAIQDASLSSNGLLGIIALIMIVMVLTNFISYK